jgi:16S rRNA (cytosine967-C5)-methyltransferase
LLDIRKSAVVQAEFLEKAASLVRTGGVVVYSTCSIEPEENFEIIKAFLQKHPEFRLQTPENEVPESVVDENGCVQTLPHRHNTDGAFAAKLIKIK